MTDDKKNSPGLNVDEKATAASMKIRIFYIRTFVPDLLALARAVSCKTPIYFVS